MLLYFIGSNLVPSGVASCGEILQEFHPDRVRLVYLNSNIKHVEINDGRMYVPVQLSHKVHFISDLIDKSEWLSSSTSWIFPNNSTVAYDVALDLLLSLQNESRASYKAFIVGMIHSNTAASIELALKNSHFLSSIISVSKEIFGKVEPRNIEKLPHRKLIYPTKFGFGNIKKENIDLPLSIAYVGRLEEEQKRVSRLLRLLETLDSSGEPFSVNIYGSGEGLHDLALQKQRFDSFKSLVQLHLHGRVAHGEVERLLHHSDVMVLTSDFEGSPLAILEAMSMGVVPVVMYYGDEVRELIDHGENGFVVDRGDVAAMAALLCNITKDRRLLQRLKRAALDSTKARISPRLWIDTIKDMSHKRRTLNASCETELVKLMALADMRIASLRSNERLAIWGAGELGRTLFDLIRESRPDLEVVAMVDEKLSVYISNYCTVDLVKPSQLLDFHIDKILIASRYYVLEITTQVQKLYDGYQRKPLLIQTFAMDDHLAETMTLSRVDVPTVHKP